MALNKFRVASLLSFVSEKVFADTYTYTKLILFFFSFFSKYALAT